MIKKEIFLTSELYEEIKELYEEIKEIYGKYPMKYINMDGETIIDFFVDDEGPLEWTVQDHLFAKFNIKTYGDEFKMMEGNPEFSGFPYYLKIYNHMNKLNNDNA